MRSYAFQIVIFFISSYLKEYKSKNTPKYLRIFRVFLAFLWAPAGGVGISTRDLGEYPDFSKSSNKFVPCFTRILYLVYFSIFPKL